MECSKKKNSKKWSSIGVKRIARERKRQITEEGWTAEHDDQHNDGELDLVGALYASPKQLYEEERHRGAIVFKDPWPRSWDYIWDKRTEATSIGDRIRALEKAGALIAAEIDRLFRLKGIKSHNV